MESDAKAAAVSDQFLQDLSMVRQILDGDDGAWSEFAARYHHEFLRVGAEWCHAQKPSRRCRYCRPGADNDCDELHNAYVFIVSQIKGKVFRSFGGRCRLDTFLKPLLRRQLAGKGAGYDYLKLFVDYIRSPPRGRPRAPKSLQTLSRTEQRVYEYLVQGRDEPFIARKLEVSPERVVEIRDRLEEVLREAGPEEYWKYLGHMSVREVPLSIADPEEGAEYLEIDPPDTRLSPEDLAMVKEVIGSLQPRERAVLRLTCLEGKTAREVAAAFGMTQREVFSLIDRVRLKIESAGYSRTKS